MIYKAEFKGFDITYFRIKKIKGEPEKITIMKPIDPNVGMTIEINDNLFISVNSNKNI